MPVSRLLVGFDKYEGDHEIGCYWVPFLKHRPTWELWFHNPAQRHLDIEPLDELTPDELRKFIEHCDIVYGLDDLAKCHKVLVDQQY